MSQVLIELARRFKGRVAKSVAQTVSERKRLKVESILFDEFPPKPIDDNSIFLTLQDRYPQLPEYGYDNVSTWMRGTDRFNTLLSKVDRLGEPGLTVLDVACGDGMLGKLLEAYGHTVELVDMADWRDERACTLPFREVNISEGLPSDDDSFDLVCSYNAFEHFPDPATAFTEMIRICKPGGTIFLEFGPLFAGPWGLHAYRTLRMPYPQFLFSAEYIQVKLRDLGIYDLGERKAELQYTNGWYLRQFKELWQDDRCEIVDASYPQVTDYLDIICEHPSCFSGRGLQYEDVVTQSISIQLRKNK